MSDYDLVARITAIADDLEKAAGVVEIIGSPPDRQVMYERIAFSLRQALEPSTREKT